MSEAYFYISGLALVLLSKAAFKVAWLAAENNEPRFERVSLVLAVSLGVGGAILVLVPEMMKAFT